MSSQHKAPLAAFFVVSIACIVVVVNALRSDALSGLFVNPTQVVVASTRLIPKPQDILAAETAVISGARVGLAAAPHVVRHVVSHAADPAALDKPKQHRHHRAASMTASTSAVPTLASTPAVIATAPEPQQVATSPVSGSTSQAHAPDRPGAVAHDAQPHLLVMHVPSYANQDHHSDTAPYGHSQRGHGQTKPKPKHDDHQGAWDHSSSANAGRPTDSDHGSSRGDHGRGNDGRGDDWSRDSSYEDWSRGSSYDGSSHDDWSRGSHDDHHGWH